MENLKPNAFVEALKVVGKAFVVWSSNWRRLLPVIVGVFLLDLALTVVWVNLASLHLNLDSMGLFFEMADNSTTMAAGAVVVTHVDEGTEVSSSRQLIEIVGEIFFGLSTTVALLSFSCTCNCDLSDNRTTTSEGQHPSLSSWREWKSLGIQLFTGLGMTIFISVLLEVLELDDDLSHYLTNFFDFVYMLAAVVASKEGLYGFSAAEKAWLIISEKFYEITVAGAMIFVVQGCLEKVYTSARFLPRKKEVVLALVIREDTAADIFRYSVAAAFLTVILQVFLCLVILAFYGGGGRPMVSKALIMQASRAISHRLYTQQSAPICRIGDPSATMSGACLRRRTRSRSLKQRQQGRALLLAGVTPARVLEARLAAQTRGWHGPGERPGLTRNTIRVSGSCCDGCGASPVVVLNPLLLQCID
ncbi:hypothetical protein VPH35_084235 [Triticum aestivum]|uniref:Uncharacterized protein n=1 Tax=Triticum aestivum TaxID=4565 RepID=A0A3B6KIP7_WHEAT